MEQQTNFPVWAIALIVVFSVVILIAIAIFFMKKHRSRSISVDTMHKLDSQVDVNEKKSMSTGSFQTVVTMQKKQHFNHSQETSSLTNTPLPQIPSLENTRKQVPTDITPQKQNANDDRSATMIDESGFSCQPPYPPQEIAISLPLPPPSASFFSDKMELDDEHDQDFYDKYLSSKNNQENSGFISIDLNEPTVYSKVQKKADAIKSSLRQPLNMPRNSVQQTLSGLNSGLVEDTQTSIKRSIESNQSTQFFALQKLQPISAATIGSTKTFVDTDSFQQKTSTKQPFSDIDVTLKKRLDNQSLAAEDEDDSPITSDPHFQEPMRAAKSVIRSASKKAKRRSMVAPERATGEETVNDEIKRLRHDSVRSKHGSVRYASMRGPKKGTGEHMTITSGSMRRLVRESILFDDNTLPYIPEASSAAIVSTNNAQKKTNNATISAVDIAGWWDSAASSKNPKHVNSTNATNSTDSHSNESIINYASSEQNTPNQYRASLNTSIFAFNTTISKASVPNASFFTDNNKADINNGDMSCHGSFRKGTLGRSTLRSLTANATYGVNRSLKGLFDYSSNSLSNKVVPDDSQKMELDSEPIEDVTKEKMAAVDSQSCGSVRRKSNLVLTTNNTKPNLHLLYVPNSESSIKYALSDEEEGIMLQEQSSKKTAIEDISQPFTRLATAVNDSNSSMQTACPSSITSTPINDNPIPLTPVPGHVDNIRRMLQDTWIANSTSTYSMASVTDSIATTSTSQSTKLNPRQQNQSLLTKSLLTQQVAKRGSLVARYQDNAEGEGFVPQEGPEPSESFSSSTMVRVDETSTESIAMRQNAITQPSNNISQQQQQSSSYDSQSTVFMSGSSRRSCAESSRGHSRKSSSGNSTATALRISNGGGSGNYAANAKTWNGGRSQQQKRSSKVSTLQPPTASEQADFYDTLGPSVMNKRAFSSTTRKVQKTRGHIPWLNNDGEEGERTPAQIERDRYLEKKA